MPETRNGTERRALQRSLPYEVPGRLPGMAPLDPADWILVDEAFAAQMALRETLLAERPAEVMALEEGARPAARELVDEVLAALDARPDYAVTQDTVIRPDGGKVALDAPHPMALLGRLVQQDFCLMEKRGDVHVMTAAILCFPASWTLAEKIGQPLVRIHAPVAEYDDMLARRVQRLFDGVRVGRPLWRANGLRYARPDLFAPMTEAEAARAAAPRDGPYLRSERQSLWRLPCSGAVAFGIHTFMLHAPRDAGSPAT